MNTPLTDEFLRHKPGMLAVWTHADYHDLIYLTRKLESTLWVAETALKAARADLRQAHEAIGKQLTDEALLYTGGDEAAADKALRVIEQLKGE